MKTLLMTGAAGRIGSFLRTELAGKYQLRLSDITPIRDVRDGETFTQADISNLPEMMELTKGKGLDVVYDPVGGPYSEPALRDMAWGGRFLVIGFAAGEIPKISLNLPLVKGCSIVGVWIGAFSKRDPARHRANTLELWKWLEQGKLRPHVWATYPLEKAADAMNALARRQVAGKVVLTPGSRS